MGGRAANSALTPALSPRERENRRPLLGESKTLGRAGVSALNRRAHGASNSDVRPKRDAGYLFPLPAGDSGSAQRQGEGEGGLQLSGTRHIEWRGALFPFAYRPFASALAFRALPSPSPRPSPLGRGGSIAASGDVFNSGRTVAEYPLICRILKASKNQRPTERTCGLRAKGKARGTLSGTPSPCSECAVASSPWATRRAESAASETPAGSAR